jgi:hypothetical protein
MSLFRRNLLLSGLAGLLACGLMAGISTWLVAYGIINPPLPFPIVASLTALVFAGFSLAEIPIMVFGMRRLLVERRDNQHVVLGLNTLYVFFAAVYGVPVLLLTGSVGWALALCGLGLLRFATSMFFVREPIS